MNKKLHMPIIVALAIGLLYVMFSFQELFVKPKYRAAIIQVMVDPTSALFRNEYFSGKFMCGEYNAKNRMGAYDGFERFISDTDNARVANAIYTISGGNNIVFEINSRVSIGRSDKLETDIENLKKLKRDLSYTDKDEYELEKAREDLDYEIFEIYWASICKTNN